MVWVVQGGEGRKMRRRRRDKWDAQTEGEKKLQKDLLGETLSMS